MRAHHIRLATAGVLLVACGGDDDDLTSDPPEEVEMVRDGGFDSPLDAVASPDGETFYFTAFTVDEPAEAALFSVPAGGGEASVLHAGLPLEDPTGLVLSCDGETLYSPTRPGSAASWRTASRCSTPGTSGAARCRPSP